MIQKLDKFLLDLLNFDLFPQLSGFFTVQLQLFILPMKLVNDELVGDILFCTVSGPVLLLVDILKNNIYQFLVQIVVFMRLLKEKSQEWTLQIELVFTFIYQ